MEANKCCAYNVSRGCKVSSKVTVADCGNDSFKLMKVMLDGLAKDPDGGFWLPHLTHGPQIVRLFPFDFVYLDDEGNILQAVELPAEAMLPRFDPRASGALILQLNSLSSSRTKEGDQLIICSEEELAQRLGDDYARPASVEALVPEYAAVPAGAGEQRGMPISKPAPAPRPTPSIPVSIPPAAAAQGVGFTLALSSSWQISNSTTAGALLDPVETEIETTADGLIDETDGMEAELSETEPLWPVDKPLFLEPVTAVKDLETALAAPPAIVEAEPEIAAGPEEVAGAISGIDEPTGDLAVPEKAEAERLTILDSDLAAAFSQELPDEFTEIDGFEGLELDAPEPESIQPVNVPVSTAEEPVVVESSPDTRPSGGEAAAASKESEVNSPVETGAEKAATARTAKAAEPVERTKPERVRTKSTPAAPRAKAEESKAKPAEAAKSASQARKKSLGYFVKEFLNCPDPLPELRAHPRLVQQGMIAVDKSVSGSIPMDVRDVSPTGFYMVTKRRWQPGKVISLSLQKKGASEGDYQSFVNITAKVVRSDEHGVGLSWVFAEGVSFDPWKELHSKRSDESDIQFFIREIRLARAQGFLQRICPSATDQIKHALHERLSNKRVAAAVEIALKAEELLGPKGSRQGLAHTEVVTRVIENGSWIEDHWIRKMWAGLLVSSCVGDGSDRSNLPFLDLLARLTPIHLRVFSFVCNRAEEMLTAGVPEAALDISSTPEELMEAADSHSFQRIQQTIGHLCNFGLLKDSARPSYAAIDERVRTKTTPTALGLKMFAHCNGSQKQ